MSLTKKEIVRSISEETGLTQSAIREIVQKTFDTVLNSLANGERVELRNFGVFDLKVRAARLGRNLSTGDSVPVPEKIVVAFKPSKEMERRVANSGNDKRFEESGFMPNAKLELDRQKDNENGENQN
jgi:nucleoid DNA-binding protein